MEEEENSPLIIHKKSILDPLNKKNINNNFTSENLSQNK